METAFGKDRATIPAVTGRKVPGHRLRLIAVALCAPLVLWGATRPLIVALLPGHLRFALLVLLGLPTLFLCGVTWIGGLALLVMNHRRVTARDVTLMLLPIVLGAFTLAFVVASPFLFHMRTSAAARAFSADAAGWDAAAARVRAEIDLGTRAYRTRDVNLRIGGTTVDEAGLDANGGVWFRTSWQADVIDRISYGLYHQPAGGSLVTDPSGGYPTSPFGAKDLKVTPLGNGWHTFEANDDFH